MTQEQLAKLLELEEFVRQERIVANLFEEVSKIEKQLFWDSPNFILEQKKSLLIEQFSKAQDEFYKFLQEVFPNSDELENVWSTYVSWFRPWNNRENDGELREIIGEPWKNKQ